MGWFGFNAGSALTSGSDAVRLALPSLFNCNTLAGARLVQHAHCSLFFNRRLCCRPQNDLQKAHICSRYPQRRREPHPPTRPHLHSAKLSSTPKSSFLFFKFSPHPACLDRRPGRRYSSRRLHHSRRRCHPRPAAGRIILRFSVCAPRALERRRCAGRVVCARCHGRHRLPVHRLLLFRRFAFFARFLLCVLLG